MFTIHLYRNIHSFTYQTCIVLTSFYHFSKSQKFLQPHFIFAYFYWRAFSTFPYYIFLPLFQLVQSCHSPIVLPSVCGMYVCDMFELGHWGRRTCPLLPLAKLLFHIIISSILLPLPPPLHFENSEFASLGWLSVCSLVYSRYIFSGFRILCILVLF